jgi:hypothetical protein
VNALNHVTSQPGGGLEKKSELWIMLSIATVGGSVPEFGCVDWFQYAQPPLNDAAVDRRLRRQQLG